uniref:Uncharacterized protein n=1 Tax=Mycena chlorophos TaxID=658473 RepID=A0ABQ0M174_MYCCL|nr:predicted protein [Mycena chlorophos]
MSSKAGAWRVLRERRLGLEKGRLFQDGCQLLRPRPLLLLDSDADDTAVRAPLGATFRSFGTLHAPLLPPLVHSLNPRALSGSVIPALRVWDGVRPSSSSRLRRWDGVGHAFVKRAGHRSLSRVCGQERRAGVFRWLSSLSRGRGAAAEVFVNSSAPWCSSPTFPVAVFQYIHHPLFAHLVDG